MDTVTEPLARELAEKEKVIAHLTKTLAHTRDCLEIARVALEGIANSAAKGEHDNAARVGAMAREALRQI